MPPAGGIGPVNENGADSGPWWKPNPLAKREKADYKRFFSIVGKHIVLYSERSGFWKYFQGAVEWLLANSDVCIHYVTGDADDQIFEYARPNVARLIWTHYSVTGAPES